eukprot:GSMAST32.ASY1.ANO1.178.1 assembled CDS
MRPFLTRLSNAAECFVSAYPNAGLPNAMGGYDETPESMASDIYEGLLNFAGGCCGSCPPHIAAISETMSHFPPRRLPQNSWIEKTSENLNVEKMEKKTKEPFLTLIINFINIGERCNLSGSRAFKRLIKAENYVQAMFVFIMNFIFFFFFFFF